ncbi:MAG: hypothetical protein FWG91_10290 [Lachnospiraceae bacterium]|nr:hypothetical protein [Lachnospiraceae bacterium]
MKNNGITDRYAILHDYVFGNARQPDGWRESLNPAEKRLVKVFDSYMDTYLHGEMDATLHELNVLYKKIDGRVKAEYGRHAKEVDIGKILDDLGVPKMENAITRWKAALKKQGKNGAAKPKEPKEKAKDKKAARKDGR